MLEAASDVGVVFIIGFRNSEEGEHVRAHQEVFICLRRKTKKELWSEIVDDGSLQTQPDGVGRIVDEIADDALVEEDVASGARLDFLIGALAARHVGTEQFLGDLQLTAHRIDAAAQQYETIV